MTSNSWCKDPLPIGNSETSAFAHRKVQFDSSSSPLYGGFNLMVMNGGTLGGCRVVSKNRIRESTTLKGTSELPQPAGSSDRFSENPGYAYQWWLLDGQDGVFMAKVMITISEKTSPSMSYTQQLAVQSRASQRQTRWTGVQKLHHSGSSLSSKLPEGLWDSVIESAGRDDNEIHREID